MDPKALSAALLPLVLVSLRGVWGAVAIDLMAFKNSKEPGNFWQQFDWQVAGWRYVQAFVGNLIGNTMVAGVAAGAGAVAFLLWRLW